MRIAISYKGKRKLTLCVPYRSNPPRTEDPQDAGQEGALLLVKAGGAAVRLLRQAPYDPAEEPGKEYGDYVVCDPKERRIGYAKEFCASTRRAGVRGGKGDLFGLSCVLIPMGFVSVDEGRRSITLH